jgi:hypothetical protein
MQVIYTAAKPYFFEDRTIGHGFRQTIDQAGLTTIYRALFFAEKL